MHAAVVGTASGCPPSTSPPKTDQGPIYVTPTEPEPRPSGGHGRATASIPGPTAPTRDLRVDVAIPVVGPSAPTIVDVVPGVDALGRVQPASMEILESPGEPVERAVREVLPRHRFTPAEAGGRRVRQGVVQRFVFRLEG